MKLIYSETKIMSQLIYCGVGSIPLNLPTLERGDIPNLKVLKLPFFFSVIIDISHSKEPSTLFSESRMA